MKQIKEAYGKTVEAAILNGAKELGVDRDLITYEIIEMPKRGFLGFGEVPAHVRVFYEAGSECTALDFVNNLIGYMSFDVTASMTDLNHNAKLIKIDGSEAGLLIGHHGETLDSLQYLVNLVANKRDGENDEEEESEDLTALDGSDKTKKQKYQKITIDIEDYRSKREETLRQLARRMAQKVLKYRKNVTLEPMNPYERRIIHSEIQNIEGVSTTSVGTDNNRRVVVYIDRKDGGKNIDAAKASPEADRETAKEPVNKIHTSNQNFQARNNNNQRKQANEFKNGDNKTLSSDFQKSVSAETESTANKSDVKMQRPNGNVQQRRPNNNRPQGQNVTKPADAEIKKNYQNNTNHKPLPETAAGETDSENSAVSEKEQPKPKKRNNYYRRRNNQNKKPASGETAKPAEFAEKSE